MAACIDSSAPGSATACRQSRARVPFSAPLHTRVNRDAIATIGGSSLRPAGGNSEAQQALEVVAADGWTSQQHIVRRRCTRGNLRVEILVLVVHAGEAVRAQVIGCPTCAIVRVVDGELGRLLAEVGGQLLQQWRDVVVCTQRGVRAVGAPKILVGPLPPDSRMRTQVQAHGLHRGGLRGEGA